MSQKNQLTLAIVTYRRPGKLARCLESIAGQTLLPKQVLVVDNDLGLSAQKTAEIYQSQLPVKYVVEKTKGTPSARNRALRENKNKLLGFVDDDCVLDKNWVKSALNSIEKQNSIFLVGQSLPLNKDNIFAQVQYKIYNRWFTAQIHAKTRQLNPEALDTKNSIFRADLFKKHQFVFDSQYGAYNISGFEDVDLGMQLEKKGLYGKFEPKMVVYHEEPEGLKATLRKAYFRGKLKYLFCQKWQRKQAVNFNPFMLGIRILGLARRKLNGKLNSPFLTELQTLILMEISDWAFAMGFYQAKSARIKSF